MCIGSSQYVHKCFKVFLLLITISLVASHNLLLVVLPFIQNSCFVLLRSGLQFSNPLADARLRNILYPVGAE